MVRELSEIIIWIWGFVVADCVREIGDMQEKICNRIAGGVILDLIQWCSNRSLGLGENQFLRSEGSRCRSWLIGMEHTEYLRDVLTTLKVLTLFL